LPPGRGYGSLTSWSSRKKSFDSMSLISSMLLRA
jgi:hypothetical protein